MAKQQGEGRGETGRHSVQSLSRAFDILNILGVADGPLTLTDIAQKASLSLSTVHRLLTTMQDSRYVRFDKGRRRWTVGVQAYRAGVGFLRTRSLMEAASPLMQRLMQDSRETVTLAVARGGEVLYLHRVRCSRPHSELPEVSSTLFHCSAAGKVLMAGMEDAEIDMLVEQKGLPQFTRTTIDSHPALRREISRIRTLGYAVDREEKVAGIRCVAAPIQDENGRPMGALSLVGPVRRMSEERVAELGDLVRRSALTVTQDIGGQAARPLPS